MPRPDRRLHHLSGRPEPSPEDVAVTRAIIEAGRLLDVEVLDNLIIGKDRHLSLRQTGLAFT
jgi:DNA repair protein RadC